MDFQLIKNIIQTEHTLLENEWEGAVLFLCNDEHVFFIRRSEKMPTHGGQIAFVGGHKHVGENNPWMVAQREFEEETSLTRDVIEFMGYLPVVMTARLKPIVPVLGRLKISTEEFMKQVTSNGEWDDCIAYPWSELCIEENWQYAWRTGYTQTPVFFSPYKTRNFHS
jgi:8-oxo-dGTP pyrophosphatase MutT (NUDIX family)